MYAGMVGKYIIEKVARTRVTVDMASEFRYRDPIIGKKDLVILISQSGETADTREAMNIAKAKGATTLALVNVQKQEIKARLCMDQLNDRSVVEQQYATATNLQTRISIHDKYSTNKMGFGNWIFSNYKIDPGMRVLELGCGTGDMWKNQEDLIRLCSRLIL